MNLLIIFNFILIYRLKTNLSTFTVSLRSASLANLLRFFEKIF